MKSGANTQIAPCRSGHAAFVVICVAFAANCVPVDQNDASRVMLLPAIRGLRVPLEIPSVGVITPLSDDEKLSIQTEAIRQAVRGADTPEARTDQARELATILNFMNSPEFEDSFQWTGRLEGVRAGMTLAEQADWYYGHLEVALEDWNAKELEFLQQEVAAGLYTLFDMRDKAILSDQTATDNELEYLIARTIQFRERLVEIAKRKQLEELQR